MALRLPLEIEFLRFDTDDVDTETSDLQVLSHLVWTIAC